MNPHDKHIKTICKLLRSCGYRYDLHNVFSDCMETAAIALSNSVDHANRDAREKRYLDIVGRYERDVVEIFPQVLAEIVLALEAEPGDVLGAVFAELGLKSATRGQFFTPYDICRAMAEMTLGDTEKLAELIERNGFVRASEPACGAGAMIIALAEAMRARGINYQQYLHVTAVDIDPCAVHMAYIQLTLMHIPAVVIVGNSLSMEMRECWYTPAHILGGWSTKLARREAEDAARALLNPPSDSTAKDTSAEAGTDELPRQLRFF
ncbi:N-6 DNA methylase [Sphingosinicella microcystinivorans]|uniref:N-6 DNA methylase n=1 Tax=Sphingosinicella microcystinivorans TaxID=335406 RepID=UPI0022F3DB7B|nr:N-6 DNA methylase [Sphingosinicella microcystinivorans]WBX84456.1 N-6 DNA methylase [Sphingosinicella microcystinivorans]